MTAPSKTAPTVETLLSKNTQLALALGNALAQAQDVPVTGIEPDPKLAKLKDQLTERNLEIVTLTRLVEDGPAMQRIAALESELLTTRRYAAELEHRHLVTIESRGFRLTAPLRALWRRLHGAPPPEPFTPKYLDYS